MSIKRFNPTYAASGFGWCLSRRSRGIRGLTWALGSEGIMTLTQELDELPTNDQLRSWEIVRRRGCWRYILLKIILFLSIWVPIIVLGQATAGYILNRPFDVVSTVAFALIGFLGACMGSRNHWKANERLYRIAQPSDVGN